MNYSNYPFLHGAVTEHINELDEQAILHCKDNIERYTPTNILELDLSSWLISTIILRCVNNNYLTRKFVANYGKFVETLLLKDINNKSIRQEILQYFGITKDVEFIHPRKDSSLVKIPIMNYLDFEGSLSSEPRLKLVNQILEKGFVIVEKPRFIYLIRVSLEQKLFKKIKNMKLYTENELINKVVEEIKARYPQFNKLQAPNKDNLPPSIQSLIDKAFRDHHLQHHERIKLGIYLQGQNFSEDFILNIFKELSDYSERTTKYQLNSLKKYIKP